jgi:hypothetical protein
MVRPERIANHPKLVNGCQRHVYYLHAGEPGVEVGGGKRVACLVCTGTGSVPNSASQQGSAHLRG